MKKILFLTVDGTHQNIIKLLADLGYEITLIARSKHKNKVETRFKKIKNNKLNLIYVNSYFSYFLKSLLNSRKYDFILYNCPISGFLSVISAPFKRKYFLMCQDFVEYLEVSNIKFKKLNIYLYKFLLNLICRASNVIAISGHVLSSARKYGSKRNFVIPIYGVDTSVFYPKKTKLKEKLGLSNKKILLCASRLSDEKGINHLLTAVKKLKEKYPNIFLLVVGTGCLEKELKQQATDLGIQENVKFVGFVDFEDMTEYYNACDIFIIPSLKEGLGLSALEAMACGRPVVGSHTGGLIETVTEKTGFSVRLGNPEDIYNAVIKIFSGANPHKIIENAKKMILEKYDSKIIMEELKKILK